MAECWDQPLPGLGGADIGVPVAAICQGRVQRCPNCGRPIVWAFQQAAMAPKAIAVDPVADERASGILTEGRGGLWWTSVGRSERAEHQDRHALHFCPTPGPRPTTRRRTPNGPTQH